MMRTSARLLDLCIKALVESVSVEFMTVLAKKMIHNYDIYEQTGFPHNIPIPKQDAAIQILNDIKKNGLVLHFASLLIEIHQNGYMGKKYQIVNLRNIIREIYNAGYIYNREYKMFVEDPKIQKTKNWGMLKDGEEYIFTFLSLDIVGNSALVREYPGNIIHAAYTDMRKLVTASVEKRNGRIWNWEGDGGLAAFFFSDKNKLALLSAMEIIQELFLYNITSCPLKKPLDVRLAVHTGLSVYSENIETVKKSETVMKIYDIESKYAGTNSVIISNSVHQNFDTVILSNLQPVPAGANTLYYSYELRWEN